MLSDTDIHYIASYLYVAADTTEITVVLGEKVYDEAADEDRDVDIVIATASDVGFIGVEVKAESRPLHVGMLEALCQKFADMPSITRRSIVSASGFSEPAIRKARAHDVDCLRLVKGRLPPFPTIDMSQLSQMTTSYLEWREGPSVSLAPEVQLSAEERRALRDDTPVEFLEPKENPPRTARELADRVVAAATASWKGPEIAEGLLPVTLDVSITDSPTIRLGARTVPVTSARLTGVVQWVSLVLEPEATCYLEAIGGEVLSGTFLVAIRSGLLGITASPQVGRLRVFHIPERVRQIRPIRQRILT